MHIRIWNSNPLNWLNFKIVSSLYTWEPQNTSQWLEKFTPLYFAQETSHTGIFMSSKVHSCLGEGVCSGWYYNTFTLYWMLVISSLRMTDQYPWLLFMPMLSHSCLSSHISFQLPSFPQEDFLIFLIALVRLIHFSAAPTHCLQAHLCRSQHISKHIWIKVFLCNTTPCRLAVTLPISSNILSLLQWEGKI